MDLMLASAAFALALLAAAAMGLALQRGGTCTVAAMDELVNERRTARLAALLEAVLWVGAGLVLAQALGVRPSLPTAPAPGTWTVVGAALLGLGALVNGACVFGAVARLGLATPLGFYAGCVTVPAWLPPPAHAGPSEQASAALLHLPLWGVGLVLTVALLRLGLVLSRGLALRRRGAGWPAVWSPHAATSSIGLAFLALLLLAGAWAYTDVLAELARRMAQGAGAGVAPRVALAGALLAGAMAGGWATGHWQRSVPTFMALARCFVGGWMLACGSLLVPGGNDSLILLGLPLLSAHAWASVAVMCAVIGAVLLARRRHDTGRAQQAGKSQP
jgi:Sulphur transport